ncbi:MAG: hypothetical protein GX487_02955 [Acetomicrobium flavidum]|uniref:Uncharacterized protein n=2 Tax=Acetomicrobium TaxID=49894 RepID=I4BYG9_ACEMN|nr:hypothetical protein [Acetomicrobium mobile]AFM22326.1 hypothetical protein Anamo_1737 [Acetomicrobium mobile DSM 13181]NLG94304.1 hypothetical protein [Acetomicrobium flavidum]SIN71627.1 hypothetical protein SAMN05444368_1446 [Acetomicrobium flavidum]
MRLYELMSSGEIVRLPDSDSVAGIPTEFSPLVALFMPFNRVLIGSAFCKSYEVWRWGKMGSYEWNEVTLCRDRPKFFDLGLLGKILLTKDSVNSLRKGLLELLEPPGDHEMTVSILQNIMKRRIATDKKGEIIKPYGHNLESSVKDITLEMAYWGLRWALLWNMTESVSRIQIWLSRSLDVLNPSYTSPPPMWFSLSKFPDESVLQQWEEEGFVADQLKHFELSESNPTVIKGLDSYLLRYIYRFKEIFEAQSLYVWLSLSVPLWEDLRSRCLLSLSEVLLACWGFKDAVDAANEMMLYGRSAREMGNLMVISK